MSNVMSLEVYKQSYTPLIRDADQDIVAFNKSEYANKVIDSLLKDLISSSNKDTEEEQIRIIIDSYMEYMKADKIPSISDIIEYVLDYNNDIICHIAEVDLANDYSENFSEQIEEEGFFVDIDETLNEIVCYWQESIYDEYCCDLEDWIEEILDRYKCIYLISRENKANLCIKFNPWLKLVCNECQNTLNPEWITSGMSYVSEFVDLKTVKVITVYE